MKFLLIGLGLAFTASAAVVADVRNKLSAGDLTSADAIADDFYRSSGATSEYAAALSWLARGALNMKDVDVASRYLTRVKTLTADLLKTSTVEKDAFLATAAGAAIEIEARLLALQGKRDQAVALLSAELPKWKFWPIQARIQKNIDLLTLEGKPAPVIDPADKGKPVLLFLWAQWCGDCKAQAPVLAKIRQRYESRGLVVRAPTRHYDNSPEEDRVIEKVWKESYVGLEDVPHPLSEEAMLRYGVSSTPTFVLIDRSGIVRMYQPYRMSEAELARHIEAVLR
jgi:thiol-disulfide isomerase/thioredoxin